MALLVRNADVHAPARIGVRDILCVSGRIVAMGDSIDAGALPFARFVEIPEAAHLPFVSHPEMVARALEALHG